MTFMVLLCDIVNVYTTYFSRVQTGRMLSNFWNSSRISFCFISTSPSTIYMECQSSWFNFSNIRSFPLSRMGSRRILSLRHSTTLPILTLALAYKNIMISSSTFHSCYSWGTPVLSDSSSLRLTTSSPDWHANEAGFSFFIPSNRVM